MADYIPSSDAEFDRFFKNLCEYVNAKCTATPPEWTHIPDAARTELNSAYAAWDAAYRIILKPCTSQERAEKTRVRIASEKTLRNFVNVYLRYYPEVTPQDKQNMGLHVPDSTRTPIEPPKNPPVFRIIQLGPRTLGIVYQDGERRKGSKPYGVKGVRIYYGVFDTPPTVQEELPASVWATRCPHGITFRETDRGRRAYFALMWETGKEKGTSPWSEIQSELIS